MSDTTNKGLTDEQIVDLELKDRLISMRPGDIELNMPLGLATFQTTAAYRKVRIRRLPTKN